MKKIEEKKKEIPEIISSGVDAFFERFDETGTKRLRITTLTEKDKEGSGISKKIVEEITKEVMEGGESVSKEKETGKKERKLHISFWDD